VTGIISGERVLSHAELQARAARAAGGFQSLGVGEGDAVALLLRNDFAFFEASLAAGMLGAYATPVNWHFTAEETGYILNDCQARVLLVHEDLWSAIAASVPAGVTVLTVPTPPEIRNAYRLGPAPPAPSQRATLSWDNWVAAQQTFGGEPQRARASMIYTSGTTGRPKGVRRDRPTLEQMARGQAAAKHVFGIDPSAPGVVLMNGPMYHSAPNAYGLAAMRAGADIVLQARFDAEEMLDLIQRHRISHMHIVPTMFVRLLKLPMDVRRRYDLSSLRFVVHGAAPCPVEVKRAMIEWWGPVINEYYGSTETGVAAWHGSADALRKPGTAGRILDGVEVAIVDDDGKELPPGAIGEIYVRVGYATDFTYQGLDDKRREVGRGGLVTLGDVGWLDDEGFLYLCDRKRDMIISGGVNIYPAEIEAVLIGMPGVRDCAVFGIPDDEFGESICAYIEPETDPVRRPATPLDPAAVRAFLGRHLARYKLPSVVELIDALPREDSGKIFKRKLRAPYWEKAGRRI
jgi:long-chain acyl-CoA synthetase